MQVNIAFEVDTNNLPRLDDQYLAAMWHLAQVNEAPFGDRVACDFVEQVGREIIRRFLVATPPALWNHQGRHHVEASQLIATQPGHTPGGAA